MKCSSPHPADLKTLLHKKLPLAQWPSVIERSSCNNSSLVSTQGTETFPKNPGGTEEGDSGTKAKQLQVTLNSHWGAAGLMFELHGHVFLWSFFLWTGLFVLERGLAQLRGCVRCKAGSEVCASVSLAQTETVCLSRWAGRCFFFSACDFSAQIQRHLQEAEKKVLPQEQLSKALDYFYPLMEDRVETSRLNVSFNHF